MIEAVGGAALRAAGIGGRFLFPFHSSSPRLPFLRLGEAAGLGPPGPPGVQIHPRFGPWWAYRALALVDRPVAAAPPPGRPCAGCSAPCVAACPPGAARLQGWDAPRCLEERRTSAACGVGCAARDACPVGADQRYGPAARAFFAESVARSIGRRTPG